MCGDRDIKLLVLHDFDKSGLSILNTLREDTRRYTFANNVNLIDLGLRLTDVQQLQLQPERAFYKGREFQPQRKLLQNGATDKEVEFLLRAGVELERDDIGSVVTFIERKLQRHGIKKIVPHKDRLDDAYRLAIRTYATKKIISRELKEAERSRSRQTAVQSQHTSPEYLKTHPQARWDEAVNKIAKAARTGSFSTCDYGAGKLCSQASCRVESENGAKGRPALSWWVAADAFGPLGPAAGPIC